MITATFLHPVEVNNFILTLSYSPKGSPALAVSTCRHYVVLEQNYLQLTITGFPYNLLLVSCCDIGFFKQMHRSSIGLDIRSQSAFFAFRALLPSANYSADLVECGSPLQIVMAGWRTFLKC